MIPQKIEDLSQEYVQQVFQDEQLDMQLDQYYLNQGGTGSGRKPSKRRVGRPSAADRKRYQYNMKRRKNSGL